MSILPTAYTEEACREAAKAAKLRYVSDEQPGITRKKSGKGYKYTAPSGECVGDEAEISRINALAIPPAYQDVWICVLKNGHLQATGRDDRKRKQYRYHPEWAATRGQHKFSQLKTFADSLPAMHQQLEKDSRLQGLPKEKVLATIILLMEQTGIRIGNAQYAAQNKTFGLTTLRKRHVEVDGKHIALEFIGKSGKPWKLELDNPRLAKTIHACEEIPGQQLFQYLDDDGHRHGIASEDVNNYIQTISGQPFTAKDFRTFSATRQALELLSVLEPEDSATRAKKTLNDTIKTIASTLGHTPAICRKSYIYPKIMEHYLEGSLYGWAAKQKEKAALEYYLAEFN